MIRHGPADGGRLMPQMIRCGAEEPVHPGRLLRDRVLPAMGVSVADAARELGVSRQILHRILAGRAGVTPGMAVRLGRYSGIGAVEWLDLQARHDLRLAERALAPDLPRIPERHLPAGGPRG